MCWLHPDSCSTFILSDLDACDALHETLRAATVRSIPYLETARLLIACSQHYSHSFYDTRLCRLVTTLLLLLLACCLFFRYIRMLRSIRTRIFLRSPLSLYCARPARSEDILQRHHSKAMGLANELVQEMLWRGKRALEDPP